MKLKDKTLLRTRAYIDGRWEAADGGATIEVLNPATGMTLGVVPDLSIVQVDRVPLQVSCP